MPQITGLDYALVRRMTDVIGKHSFLDPESAFKLAENVVRDMEFRTEEFDLQGADYLGGVRVARWVTGWFKR